MGSVRFLAAMVVVAVAVRLPALWFLELNWDEGLYRLVAGRLLAGVAPYLEVWDRKPVGLFVLVAGMEAASGGSVAGLRVALSVLVGVSGALAGAIAWVLAPGVRWAGWGAGLAYVLGTVGNHGLGVNGELLLAPFALGGVLLALRAAAGGGVWVAAAAGLALGAAVQVKQVALFDAVAAGGMAWLWAGRVLAWRLVLAGVAGVLVPLGLAVGWYAAIGALPVWWQANVAAVLAPGGIGMPGGVYWKPVAEAAPLLVLAVAGAWLAGRRLAGMLGLWAGCVGLAMVAVGRWLDHETLHLLPVLAVAIGVGLGRWPGVLAAAWVGLGLWHGVPAWRGLRLEDRTAALAEMVRGAGSLYVAGKSVELYRAVGVAAPTRFAFVPHLWLPYARVDGVAEMRRILAGRPEVIVVDDFWLPRPGQFAPALLVLHAALRAEYAVVGVSRGAVVGVVFRRK